MFFSRSPTPGPSSGRSWLLTSPVSFTHSKYSDDFDFSSPNTQTNTPATSFSSASPKIFSTDEDFSDDDSYYPDLLQIQPLKSTHCSKCGFYIHPTLPGATPL